MIRLRGSPTRPCTIHPSSDLRVRNRRAQLPECSAPSTNGVMLRRFAWSSLPSASFSAARLHEAAALWRFNNERHHVSGMLLFTGIHFLAIVEVMNATSVVSGCACKRTTGIATWFASETSPAERDGFRGG